ncbi:MAG: RNA polymerase sigma factor RpoH [Gammaproteobacteria bacterium]|nr:RNA polymerase sigma factor RpoH [Gammaproteobacteria bacterium]MCP4474321.1 RNA polymerase sigma factor RpoH [Gammaproteobacteria bacterium]
MNSKALNVLDTTSPLGNLEAYIHWANQVPVLSAEEEQALAVNYQEKGDLQAAKKLVMAHLRFVIKIARNYNGYGLNQGDLVQEGNIGLMKAVKRFDPSMGVRLVSFAVHWIKAEIHEFILRNWRIVKVATTKAQRKLFFNLRSMKKRLGWLKEEEINDVAATLNIKPSDVVTMEQRLNSMDISFDPLNDDRDDSDGNPMLSAPAAYLGDHTMRPDHLLEQDHYANGNQARLAAALDNLDERSRDILSQRWLSDKKSTLHQLADQYGISAERIRQLEQQAILNLRDQLETL